jgi:hypothetical protein
MHFNRRGGIGSSEVPEAPIRVSFSSKKGIQIMARKPTKIDKSKPARSAITRMSEEERKEITRTITKAVSDRDLPTFRAGLARLGYAETSAEYEKLLSLWDDYWSASRHD